MRGRAVQSATEVGVPPAELDAGQVDNVVPLGRLDHLARLDLVGVQGYGLKVNQACLPVNNEG